MSERCGRGVAKTRGRVLFCRREIGHEGECLPHEATRVGARCQCGAQHESWDAEPKRWACSACGALATAEEDELAIIEAMRTPSIALNSVEDIATFMQIVRDAEERGAKWMREAAFLAVYTEKAPRGPVGAVINKLDPAEVVKAAKERRDGNG